VQQLGRQAKRWEQKVQSLEEELSSMKTLKRRSITGPDKEDLKADISKWVLVFVLLLPQVVFMFQMKNCSITFSQVLYTGTFSKWVHFSNVV